MAAAFQPAFNLFELVERFGNAFSGNSPFWSSWKGVPEGGGRDILAPQELGFRP